MGKEGTSEKPQPRMVTSFNKTQLESVQNWLANNVDLSEASSFLRNFIRALDAVKLDEKGKQMDDKARDRLRYGLAVINILRKEGVRPDSVVGVIQVWQGTTPDENKLEIRYDYKRSNSEPRLRRY